MTESFIKKPAAKKPGKYMRKVLKCWELYLFLLPAIVVVFIFSYIPMYGLQLAFKVLTPGKTIYESAWVGLRHFERLFRLPQFFNIVKNTASVALAAYIIEWSLPIILALLINQVENSRFKKTLQTVSYMPHLFSVVVVISIASVLLSPRSGIVNIMIQKLGGEPILFFGSEKYVIPIYVLTDIWQNLGYETIIYLAALSAVGQDQIEAATIDGASKIQKIFHIELPTISNTIIIIQLLRLGRIFSVGIDKMLLLQRPLNLGTSEIISTYIYKVGLQQAQYGFSTAVGLFNTLINLTILLLANAVARKFSETSIF